MKYLAVVILLLVVSGCASSMQRPGSSSDGGAALRLAEADLKQSMDAFGDRVIAACVTSLLSSQNYGESEKCVREKVAQAVANPAAEKYCGTLSEIGDYGVCVMMGEWLNVMRRNAGSPKELSEEEWLHLEKAADNTTTEILTQSLVQCAGKPTQLLESCQSDLLVKSLGVSTADVQACNGVTDGKCLGARSIAQYVRDKTLMVW